MLNNFFKRVKSAINNGRIKNFFYWITNIPSRIVVTNALIYQKCNKIRNNNLGDDINFYMIKELTSRPVINYWDICRFGVFHINNYMCIGSILEYMVTNDTIVWGAGALYGGDRRLKAVPKKILAVRGKLTREYLLNEGIKCPEVYGDPALLLPFIIKCNYSKKYKLGIIPHYVDLNNKKIIKYISSNPDAILIDFRNYDNWKQPIELINQCETIVSSSLHGLIISDAYGIPNMRMVLSDNITGGNFKYLDYYSAVGKKMDKETSLLDFRNESDLFYVDCEMIKNNYIPIQYDYKPLIESCPFLNLEERKNLLNKIHT